VRRALVSMGLVCLLAVAAVGAEFAVQSWMSFDLVSSGECTIGGETHRDSWFQNPYAWLVAEYSEGNWTLGLGTKFSPAGLCQVIAGARGVLGPFNFASYMEFGQETCGDEVCPGRFTPMKDQEVGSSSAEPRFVDWKSLAWTSVLLEASIPGMPYPRSFPELVWLRWETVTGTAL